MSVDNEVTAINALRMSTKVSPVFFVILLAKGVLESSIAICLNTNRKGHISDFAFGDNARMPGRLYEPNSLICLAIRSMKKRMAFYGVVSKANRMLLQGMYD